MNLEINGMFFYKPQLLKNRRTNGFSVFYLLRKDKCLYWDFQKVGILCHKTLAMSDCLKNAIPFLGYCDCEKKIPFNKEVFEKAMKLCQN